MKAREEDAEGETRHEDLSELRHGEPGRPRLLRVRRVPALGADRVRRGRHARDGRRPPPSAAAPPRRPPRRAAAPRPPPAGAARRRAAAPPQPPPRRPPPRRPPAARRPPVPRHGRAAPAPPPRRAAPPEPEAPRQRRRSRCGLPGRATTVAATTSLALGVDPGGRERVLALIRNQSRDRRQLRSSPSRGLPDDVVDDLPDTRLPRPVRRRRHVRAGGRDPPAPAARAEAEARIWELELVAHSKAHETRGGDRAVRCSASSRSRSSTPRSSPSAPPGRRKARYQVAVENKANAPVARRASTAPSPTASARSRSSPPHVEIAPGETIETTMTVRPPKQIWIGRPHERRLEVRRTARRRARQRPRRRRRTAELEERRRRRRRRARQAARGSQKPGVRGPQIDQAAARQAAGCRSARRACGCASRSCAARASAARSSAAEPPPRPAQDAEPRRRRAPRGHRPAAADAGRLPPEAVAAVVGGDRRPAARCCSRCCCSSSCPRTSPCPRSSARSRRSRPRRRSPRPG